MTSLPQEPKPVESSLKDEPVLNEGPYSADSSGSFRFPTTECKKYQQWFEPDPVSESRFRRFLASFRHQYDSPLHSAVILVVISLLSILLVLLFWHLFPLSPTVNSPAKNRVQSYRSIPQEEIGYVFENAFPLHLENPRCFCTDSQDHLYVGGDRSLVVFSTEGTVLSSFSLKEDPNCLTVSRANEVFADNLIVGYDHSFEVFRKSDNDHYQMPAVFHWSSSSDKSVLKRILTGQKTIYVADAGEKRVLALDTDGKVCWSVGKPREDESFSVEGKNSVLSDIAPSVFPGFVIPNRPYLDLVLYQQGQMLAVTNPGKHRIEHFTSEGVWKPELTWGTPGVGLENFCGCCNPVGLSRLPNGNWVTVEKYLPRIKVYDPKGAFKTVVTTPEELENPPALLNGIRNSGEYIPPLGADRPFQIAVLTTGRVVVLDPTYRVLRFYTEK
ncbi:MAG: hypothetical protein ACRC10_01620 [Thermoguttaceae bacterium]